MGTVALTNKNFEDYVSKDGILIIDWWAPWCGPCKVFAPVFDKAAERYPDITFAKVNTEDEPDLAGSFQINAVPTLMVFRDQILVFEQPGVLRAEQLDELLSKVKELDMNEVRKEVEEHEREHVHDADGDCCGGEHGHGHDHDA